MDETVLKRNRPAHFSTLEIIRALAMDFLTFQMHTQASAASRRPPFWSLNQHPGTLPLENLNRSLNPVNRGPLEVRFPALLTEPSRNRVHHQMVAVPMNGVGHAGPGQTPPAEMTLQRLRPSRFLVLKSLSHSIKDGV